MNDAADSALDAAFAAGDYHRVAASRRADRWRTFAALGLCGNCAPALDGLARFDDPDARFYEAVTHWIDGNEDAAARGLEACEDAHAEALLALIRKPRIQILSQLPWSQFGEGPHTVLDAARSSAKFSVRNIGCSPGDIQNAADADIHAYYDRNDPPDFYLAQMIEWQLIPPNLQELPCPIIGQTADFDLHIHVVHRWLRLFDQLIVTDTTEFDDVARLVDAPIATFPKTFCLPRSLPPPPPPGGRDIDLLLTGTTFHSYHREKAEILHQILRVPDIEPFVVNGYLDWWQYHAMLARARLSVSHIRHPGASPSRGVETLAMGAVLLAQPETTLRLWVGEAEGLLSYDLTDGGLGRTVAQALAAFPKHEAAARRGMAIIREEFEPDRLGAQYLRFATFLAARPRGRRSRRAAPPQRRLVAWQGWLPKDGNIHLRLHETALKTMQETPADAQTVESLNAPARDAMLDFVQATLEKSSSRHAQFFATTLEIYRLALQLRAQSLALRFNFIRAALHFGGEPDIDQALVLARETLNADASTLELDPCDDVMTWDYCPEFFNYRSYFDLVTDTLMDGVDRTGAMKELILASIAHYCGRMGGDADDFAESVARDPQFPAYRLARAKALIRQNQPDAARQAAALLRDLANRSLLAAEAASLLQAVKLEHGIEIPDLAPIRKLETHTLLDSDHEAIRNGPYFRSQRLALARNGGHDVLRRAKTPVALSVLLADANGSRYRNLARALEGQSLSRSAFEIVAVDVFDRVSPGLLRTADTVVALGQNEYLYNRNAAFNVGLAQANGRTVILFDRDGALEADFLRRLLQTFEGRDDGAFMAVNRGGLTADRRGVACLALARTRALRAGGLDESPYRSAGLGGPYELAQRLSADRPETAVLDGFDAEPVAEERDIEPLLRDLSPYAFSAARRLPRNENPAIQALREGLA